MASKSDWLEAAVLNHFLRGSAASAVATPYVGLFTTTPGETDSGVEVAGPVGTTGYERKAVTFGAPTAGTVQNTAQLLWGPALTSWGSITSFGIYDAATAGNLLYYGDFASPVSIGIDDLLAIITSALTISEL